MEREQIIKALERCVHIRVGQYCGSYPYDHMLGCRVIMNNDAIALISELTEENERLRAEVAREIFADLEKELNAALENNYKRKRELAQAVDGVDNFDWLVGGKIDTLRGILDFLEELKKKYGVE